MARKKVEPIIGLGNEDKLTVQKSLPLFALWQSDLTLSEFKILDTYLSRIDSHKPEKRQIVLKKGEIEQALGVKKINNQDLKIRLKHLMGNVVEIPDKDVKKGFRLVTIFEEAEAEQDDCGLWQVKLECTQKAMKYFFNVENLGYLRYKLRSITSLTSRYTYIMFTYLEHNRFRKSWEVGLDELKAILHCDNEETYKEFKFFNVKILKKVQKELHEKTECRYTYEPVKKNRKVIAIKFTLETLADQIVAQVDSDEVPGQLSLEDYQIMAEDPNADPNAIYADVLPKEFTPEEIEALRALVAPSMPYDPFGPLPVECKIADYLAQQVAIMNARNSRDPIKNKFSYLKTMIKNDLGE